MKPVSFKERNEQAQWDKYRKQGKLNNKRLYRVIDTEVAFILFSSTSNSPSVVAKYPKFVWLTEQELLIKHLSGESPVLFKDRPKKEDHEPQYEVRNASM